MPVHVRACACACTAVAEGAGEAPLERDSCVSVSVHRLRQQRRWRFLWPTSACARPQPQPLTPPTGAAFRQRIGSAVQSIRPPIVSFPPNHRCRSQSWIHSSQQVQAVSEQMRRSFLEACWPGRM